MQQCELHGCDFKSLKTGMSTRASTTISQKDVEKFADVSGDHNPLHLDADYAKTTPFKGRIVHGMFCASLISSVIGNKLPGPGCIYMSQTLTFLAPVRAGDTVETVVTITELQHDQHVLLDTKCYVNDTVVLEGEALIKVPERHG